MIRTIGTSLDNGYRDDLNYNFRILADRVSSSNEILDSTKKELFEMIDNLQQQLITITDTDWVGLSEQLTKAINESLEALAKVDKATSDAETTTEEAIETIKSMNDIIINFSFNGEYNDSQEYRKYNNVYFKGSSYFYINDTPSKGNAPPDFPIVSNDYWRMSASKGVDGSGSVSKVNGKGPNGEGEVVLTPNDIGAAPVSLASKVATEEELGLIKPDGVSILVDKVTGVASVKGVGVEEYSGDLNDLTEDGQYETPTSTINAPTTTKHLIEVRSSVDKKVVIQTATSIASSGNRQTYRRTGHKNNDTYAWSTEVGPGSMNGWKIEDVNLSDSLTDDNVNKAATANAVRMVNEKISGGNIELEPLAPFIVDSTGGIGISKIGNIATFFFRSKNSQIIRINAWHQPCNVFPSGYVNSKAVVSGTAICTVSGTISFLPFVINDGNFRFYNSVANIPVNTVFECQISFDVG